MKKKFAVVSLLFILTLTLSGCSSSKTFPREHNAKNDMIKFYGLEWLTEKKEVEKKLDDSFGADSYKLDEEWFAMPHNGFDIFSTRFVPTDERAGIGEVGGYAVSEIEFNYMTLDKKNFYLYRAKYYFADTDLSNCWDLERKLDALYPRTKEETKVREYSVYYTDSNNNEAHLYHHDSWYDNYDGVTHPASLGIFYICGDMRDYIDKKDSEEYQEYIKQTNNGL